MPTLPVLRLLPAALLLLLSPSRALAMGLGEATVRSALGSPLHVEIALRTAPDEVLDEQCISLVPVTGNTTDATAALGLSARLSQGARRMLLIDSTRAVTEPFANLRVRLDCGGTALVRDYALLIDPPAGAASAPLFTATGLAASPTSAPATPGASTGSTVVAPGTAPGHPAPRRRAVTATSTAGSSHLRLDFGTHAATTGLPVAATGGIAIGVLRLDPVFSPPAAVTTDLVAERERLREMRTLLLSEDNPVDRLLVLQNQVNVLDGQLRALQGHPASTLTAVPAVGTTPAKPTSTSTGPKLQPAADGTDAVTLGLWAAAALGVGLLGGGLMLLRRRQARRDPDLHSADRELASALLASQRGARDAEADDRDFDATVAMPAAVPRRAPADVPGSGRRQVPERKPPAVATPASASRSPAPAQEDMNLAARSAYLTARFPELAAGLIQLNDPDSVVAGARLYVDHGDHDRANELLEAAIQGPCENDVRPWLALFELHRLREEASPYAVLLERFRARFVASRYIPEILAVGRQLDPGRAEFQAPEGTTALLAPSEGTTWLNPELDFVPQALAQELHDTLMAELQDDEPATPGRQGKDGDLHR